MAIDLSGGLDEAREFVFAQQPDDPEMRESVNAWVWDEGDAGKTIGLPRIGIEAVADQWNTHDVQLNIAFADGRVLTYFEPGKVHDPLGPDGRPRVLGGGPLSFELVEPFRRWRMRFDGLAVDNHVEKQMAGGGRGGEPTVPVEFDLDLVSAAPPWDTSNWPG
jgi:prepilin-type processing-associated H-X9-DG protein